MDWNYYPQNAEEEIAGDYNVVEWLMPFEPEHEIGRAHV